MNEKRSAGLVDGLRLAGAAWLSVAVLGLAACGGGGGGGGGDTPAPSQAPAASAPATAAPAISVQPQAQSAREGGSTTFSVSATGAGPFTYRWQRNGVDIDGATASSFTVNDLKLVDSQAVYTVRVSNASGSVTSQGATLTVRPPAFSLLAGDLGALQDPLPAGYAGTPVDGPAGQARFATIRGLAADGQGNVYVAEVGAVRKISAGGAVTTLAGDLTQAGLQYAQVQDGTGTAARFSGIRSLSLAPNGDLYVLDRGYTGKDAAPPVRIRKITPEGTVTTVLRSNNPATSLAMLENPVAMAVSPKGEIHVLDLRSGTNRFLVRKVDANGTAVTVPGGDLSASLPLDTFFPAAVLRVDGQDNVYVAFQGEGGLCQMGCATQPERAFLAKLTAAGAVTVLAGATGYSNFRLVKDGPGASAVFIFPNDIALDPLGNLYVADAYWNARLSEGVWPTWREELKDYPGAVRKVSTDGAVATPVGVLGKVTGPQRAVVPGALPGMVNLPNAVAVAPDGTLYFTSGSSHVRSQVVFKVESK